MGKINGKLMYMPKDHLLRSINGCTVQFKTNEPIMVPARAVDEAITIGAVFSNKEEQRVLVDEPPKLVEPAMGFEREQDIFNACAALADRNNPDDFTPGSKPTLEAVKNIVGYDIDRKEVNKVWMKVMQARANAA